MRGRCVPGAHTKRMCSSVMPPWCSSSRTKGTILLACVGLGRSSNRMQASFLPCAISLSPATPNGNNGWYTSPVTVTITGHDNRKVETIEYRIDGGSWKTYSAPITISIDGEHTVDYRCFDDVGNPSETGTVSFKIDATAPTVSIDTPQSGYIYFMGRELFANPLGGTIIIGGITFAATASDAMSGLKKVSFDIDGYSYEKTSSPYEVWWHKFDLLPTKYTLSVSAEDNAGNTASAGTIEFTHWL